MSDETERPEEENSEDTKYKEYCKSESDEAYRTIVDNQSEYDKQLLTLSTGTLAVLIAFLKDLIHLDTAVHKWILYCSIFGLGITILAVIISFQVSIFALERVRKYYEEHHKGNTAYLWPDKASSWVARINRGAGLAFVCAIALALTFIVINLAHQTTEGAKHGERIDSGRVNNEAAHGESRGTRLSYQGTHPECPEGEQCKY